MSVGSRVASGVVSVGLLASAMWLYGYEPRLRSRLTTPIASEGRIGAQVDNRVFSVRVDRVDVATGIVKAGVLRDSPPMRSLGVFVIVHLRIRSNQKPFDPGHARLITRGDVAYAESGRPELSVRNGGYQPMIWGETTYVFEIPKDRLAGARLAVGEARLLDQLSAECRVDLGIDRKRAAELLARPPADYRLRTT